MALALTAEGQRRERGGLRPMNPTRDLGAIARLISLAFADDLDERARAALREMRWMARLSPFVWWWSQTDPQFRESFSGFVWEEFEPGTGRRQIVGNVSLNRAPGNPRRWILCNVAVRPEYRRQGIARRLTEAAIREARDLGAEGVVLQVYRDNLPAMRLYADLGFREAAGETALRLESIPPVAPVEASLAVASPLTVAPSGYDVRAWRRTDGPAAYDLARQTTPSEQQWLVPIRATDYEQEAWGRLSQWLTNQWAGRRAWRLTVLKEDRLVALVTVAAALRGPGHSLTLLVHREHRGQVEQTLLSRAVSLLGGLSSKPVWASVDCDHAAAVEALRHLGFQEKRTLLTLRKDLV